MRALSRTIGHWLHYLGQETSKQDIRKRPERDRRRGCPLGAEWDVMVTAGLHHFVIVIIFYSESADYEHPFS